MIRTALQKDEAQLEGLYAESIYKELPALVRWALKVVPERVVIVEEHGEIWHQRTPMSVGTTTCG